MGSRAAEVLGTESLEEFRAATVRDAEEKAYKESAKLPVPRVTGYLLETVGQRVTAVGVGVKDVRPIRVWEQGGSIRQENERRLRLLFRVARTIQLFYDESTARAFLRSSSPYLDDEAPVMVIGTSGEEREAEVVEAMRSFLDG